MYGLGRLLQMLGLIIVPMALFYGFREGGAKGVAQRELMILAGGGALFLLGIFLQSRARR